MKAITSIGNFIKSERERVGFTVNKLAERSGLANYSVTRIEEDKDVRLSTLLKALKGLNIGIKFYRKEWHVEKELELERNVKNETL